MMNSKNQQTLDILVSTHQLYKEPPNQTEFNGILKAARLKRQDSQLSGLSINSQFILAYDTAHNLSLAALHWHGYRANNRYVIFQSLQYTLDLSATQWHTLNVCRHSRNTAEYDGLLDINEALLNELLNIIIDIELALCALGSVITE